MKALAEKLINKSGVANFETLSISPSLSKKNEKIYLTKSKSSWITIEWVTDELDKYSKCNYDEMFALHPSEKGKVVMYEKEVISPRWHRSYLMIPNRDQNAKRSFMYSGLVPHEDLSLPSKFQIYLDFLNKTAKEKFNQVLVNWYSDGNDFIAAHSDCQFGMQKNAEISIISLYKDMYGTRNLIFTPKKTKGFVNDFLYKKVEISAKHGSIITMHGDTQLKFRHKIPKSIGLDSSRISLTFRKFETNS
ncbi:alpha-ketoglutarate-dependent dioxygenase AlkB [Flammeovirga kamogawensis]|uniref:Alpha-ketoglutarate-dependent dioxygenase AlkB n=1 Tax=Flammeovirga kamogawensis TaxID=373891 RepID=A0ABX8GW86_9BACT|nr:alpha-ketoglutarate-dependent dioxygenase AlkB [Flammeovirga kamogawensis]MBB6461313.1 alkylated DNA repair dioxygenase AlkB [Flammeovirga kamogawensis]QWG07870.1 alpha-ketoglutarate-dependent dioxygenase AlkB [Flammeovirga kamogawensis]TRX69677.1 hypothetical protein EO216_16640 [Flammeovirga kamogawensis]